MRSAAAATDVHSAASGTAKMRSAAADMAATADMCGTSTGMTATAGMATATSLRCGVRTASQNDHGNENNNGFEFRHGNRLASMLPAQLRASRGNNARTVPGFRAERCRMRDLAIQNGDRTFRHGRHFFNSDVTSYSATSEKAVFGTWASMALSSSMTFGLRSQT